MDFESKINSLEVELGRLRAQKEQEQAMQEVLPARFEMNMAAFLHYIPDIYEKFKTYNPVRGFSFFAVKTAFLICSGTIPNCHFMVTILIRNVKIRLGQF